MKTRQREDEILEEVIGEIAELYSASRDACDALTQAESVETLRDFIANVVDAGLQFDALAKKCAEVANAARVAREKVSK